MHDNQKAYEYADRCMEERHGPYHLATYRHLGPAAQQEWDAEWNRFVDEYWDNLEDDPQADVQVYGDER